MGGSVIGAIIIGAILTAVAFAHAIGPALMLAVVTPFDAIPWQLFGVVGNAITYVPILIFLLKVSPARWGQTFLGTRVQQYAALLILLLLVSHSMAIVDKGLGEIIDWVRKVTLFLLMGVFAYAMRDARHLALLAKVMVVSMTLLVFLAALDFYAGVQVLPLKVGLLGGAALEQEFQSHQAGLWRFTGPGLPVNRFANYLLLLIFLGAGWFMSVRSPYQRAMAFACTAILVLGEMLTVSRAGILGAVVGALVLIPMVVRFRPQQLLGLVLVGSVFAALLWYGLGLTSGGEVLSSRFEVASIGSGTAGRLTRLVAAVRIWSEAPILGVGWGAFTDYSGRWISQGGKSAHNGWARVLAEAGVLGFLPLAVLTIAVVRRSLVRVGDVSPQHEFWRPYFFGGLVAQLVSNVFNDYLWERYLWVSFAFVVTLENLYHVVRAKQARERLEHVRKMGKRPAFASEAGAS